MAVNRMNVTDSSPLTPPPASQPQNQQSMPSYRTTRELAFELNQHVQVYFEESMFTQGFRLLLSIMSADASTPSRPITMPAPKYLAMISTLAIHPSVTTRTSVRDKWEQANSALRLLRFLLKTTGPINSRFTEAFSFTKYNHDQENDFNSYYADEGSLWSQAEDFWAVVGWVLNCSCLSGMYAARWERWSLWMNFMLEVLETDWQLHYTKDTCEESLLWQYVELATGAGNRHRRVLRAIFADGSSSSLNEFREVFRKELRPPPSDKDKPTKRQVDVNIDADIYGDYLAKEDDSDSSSGESRHQRSRRSRTRTPSRTRRATPKSSNQSLRTEFTAQEPPSSTLGPRESLTIRLRLLHLLSHIAGHPTLTSESPTTFPSLDELYTEYVEFIKPLPLATFQQIISPSVHSIFSPDAHSTLCEFLLQRMIESAAPSVHGEAFLTQTKLQDEYLPFCASRDTLDANCRVSLLLEALLRWLNLAGCLVSQNRDRDRDVLINAVEMGVQRRLSKVQGKRKMTSDNRVRDEIAWYWLVESGERMRMIAREQ